MGNTLSKFSLEDRVAIVTGAGRGIGKGIAISFAEVGAHIVVSEIDPDTGRTTADKVRALGRKSLAVTTDVRDSKQVAKLVEATMKEFGHIDILVNNAGGAIPLTPVVALGEEDWDWIMAIALKSVFLCCQAAARVMIDQKKGNIINISSMAGLRSVPGLGPYGAAKAGVISLTRTLAAELARYNIRVNTIAPGAIETPMLAGIRGSIKGHAERIGVPLGRIGYPEDITAAAIYLASDASDYVSGETIEVKGGPYTRKGDMEQFVQKFPNL